MGAAGNELGSSLRRHAFFAAPCGRGVLEQPEPQHGGTQYPQVTRPCTNASFRPGAARPGLSPGPAVGLPSLVGRLQSRVIPRHRIRASDRGFGAFLRLWGQRGAGCGLRPCSGPVPDPSGPQPGDSVLVCVLFSPAPPPGGFAGAVPAMGPAPASGSSDPELPNLSWCTAGHGTASVSRHREA